MSGTTANYDFPYPTSTDLVRNGASAIQSLADGIDAYISGSSGTGKLFYIAGSDSTSTSQTTSSATYVTKSDCQVTGFSTGASGVFAVILWANLQPSADGNVARASVSISGAVSFTPTVGGESGMAIYNKNAQLTAGSVMKIFDGTPNTSTTVTLNMASSSGTSTVNDAFIQVICLG